MTRKYSLKDDQIPRHWYNIAADLPSMPPPPLHPGTGQPIGPDDLAPLFPMALIGQEVSTERMIEIPDPIRDVLAMWRPTPLFRAENLEAALGTDCKTFYKYEGTSPAEAALGWAIPRVRRQGGARAGGFPGASRILQELEAGPARLRVGLAPEGRAPVREGAPLFADPEGGAALGHVTSGGFAPSLDAPVAMGYLPAALAAPGTPVWAEVRGRRLPCTVRPLPFRTPTYKR